MKKEIIKKQSQHIVPQTYLKQFGYLDKNNQYKVSVIDKTQLNLMSKSNKFWVSQKSIESILKEDNIYNLSCEDGSEGAVFEDFSARLESNFTGIVQRLKNDGFLHKTDESNLVHFIALLLCKTSRFRDFIFEILKSENCENFINQILEAHEDDGINKSNIIESLEISNYDINFVMLATWKYISKHLHYFYFHILKCDRGFFTSDCPVIVNELVFNQKLSEIITDLYFPICSNYAIKMSLDEQYLSMNREIINVENDESLLIFLSELTINYSVKYIIYPAKFDARIPIVLNELDIDNANIK